MNELSTSPSNPPWWLIMRREISRTTWVYSALIVLLVCASFYYLSVGAVTISFYEIISAIQHRWLQQPLSIEQQVILELRLPRLLFAMLVGAGLAASGVASQGLFRNPLADPAMIGVAAGAAFGAAAT